MLVGGGHRWKWDCQNKERSSTNFQCYILDAYPFDFIHFHIGILQSNAKLCTYSIISHSKAWGKKKVLQKSSYEDSCLCISLCICMCVYQSLGSLLIASERLTSLIEAHRRPSTPRPRGIPAETHKQSQLLHSSVWNNYIKAEEDRQTASPSSPTAARSPSSLWLRLSVSPPAGVWLLLPHRCLSASGSTSHLSTIWWIVGVKVKYTKSESEWRSYNMQDC